MAAKDEKKKVVKEQSPKKEAKPKQVKAEAVQQKPPQKKGRDTIVIRSKRKEAVARAYIRKGRGIVRINKLELNAIGNSYTKAIMSEPLTMIDDSLAKSVDIDIDVYGGGAMGQAQAVRSAIARALVAYTQNNKLREMFQNKDKFLLVEDSRRVEPKKYKGPKARARFQKSYR